MELVSVIIPTYGCRGHLKESIDSVLAQSYKALEIIVVDDNPSNSEAREKTEAIMESFSSLSSVIYIKHKENRNGAAARNTGIRLSKGDFIAFLDDDDSFFPSKLEEQVNYLNTHSDLEAVYCWAVNNGRNYSPSSYEGRPMKEMLMLQTCMYTPCLMFRRQPLLSIGGFDEALTRHQDYDLLLRFFGNGYSIGCLRKELTEIGSNEGENEVYGARLEELKEYFFTKFASYIDDIDKKEPGFKKKVYAKHYASVFLRHVKKMDIIRAVKVLFKYFILSPRQFLEVLKKSIKAHI